MNAAPPLISMTVAVVELDITGTVSTTLSIVPGRMLVHRAKRDAGVPVGTIASIEQSTPLVFG